MSVPYLTARLPARGAGCESPARGDGLGVGARLLTSCKSIRYYKPQFPLSSNGVGVASFIMSASGQVLAGCMIRKCLDSGAPLAAIATQKVHRGTRRQSQGFIHSPGSLHMREPVWNPWVGLGMNCECTLHAELYRRQPGHVIV